MKRYGILLLLLLTLTGCAGEPEKKTENLQFLYQGIPIALDAEAAPLLEALGTPKSYTEETSCAFDGLDKTYYYGSFYLTTYPGDGAEYVSGFWFVDDTAATREGIRIGSTKKQVEQAYDLQLENRNTCTLTQGEGTLTILLEEDVVTSIQYARIFS